MLVDPRGSGLCVISQLLAPDQSKAEMDNMLQAAAATGRENAKA
jgi:hypothetical protein